MFIFQKVTCRCSKNKTKQNTLGGRKFTWQGCKREKKGFILQTFKNNSLIWGSGGCLPIIRLWLKQWILLKALWSHGAFSGGHIRGAEIILGMLLWAFRNCTICPSLLLGWEQGDGERIRQWNCLCWESVVFTGQDWGLAKRKIKRLLTGVWSMRASFSGNKNVKEATGW